VREEKTRGSGADNGDAHQSSERRSSILANAMLFARDTAKPAKR
jgi:hypothetical protein